MRRGDVRPITVDGKAFDAEYLGRGHYATAWRAGERVYLFVVDCYMKEAVANWGDKDNPHVPKIERHDDDDRRGVYRDVYSMPFYANLTAKDAAAWPVYRTLEAAAKAKFREFVHGKPLAVYGYEFSCAIIDATRGKVPELVTEALESLRDAGSNYGAGVTFEFGRRNLGTDAEGRLVFRDILFDADKMQREWAEKWKRRGGW